MSSQPFLQLPITEKITAVSPDPDNIPSSAAPSGVVNLTVWGAGVAAGGIEVRVTTGVAGAQAEVANRNKIQLQTILHTRKRFTDTSRCSQDMIGKPLRQGWIKHHSG